VYPGGSWLPPAGRCPTVQEWHGTGETLPGSISGSRLREESGEYGCITKAERE
jgi:hypothetical protein